MSISSTGVTGAIPKPTSTTTSTSKKQDEQFYPLDDYLQPEKTGSNSVLDTSNLRTPTAELGQDAFMQILVAQLANQDPLEPMKDTDFIAQMAQFTALEQMQALNQQFQNSQAYSMIGKTVVATTYIKGADGQFTKTTLVGPVSGIQTVNNKPYLIIGDNLVDPSAVSEVYDGKKLSDSIMENGLLVGKHVVANKVDENGDKIGEISGKITKIFAKDGRVYAVIDGKEEVAVSYITAIADEPIPITPPEEGGDKPEGGGDKPEGGENAGGVDTEQETEKA